MEIIKQKSIELLLDIITKEIFEEILYEKIMKEESMENKLLFDIVNINYRKEDYKNQLLNILKDFISKEVRILYRVNLYSNKIINSTNDNVIKNNFEKIHNELFDYDKDYGLMWNFYNIQERFCMLEIGYEIEKVIIFDLKKLCFKFIYEFKEQVSINDKIKLLEKGLNGEVILKEKKWYEFWR